MTATIVKGKDTLVTKKKIYTPSEYLALENQAQYKHEYRNGEIIPMAGGTVGHNQKFG